MGMPVKAIFDEMIEQNVAATILAILPAGSLISITMRRIFSPVTPIFSVQMIRTNPSRLPLNPKSIRKPGPR